MEFLEKLTELIALGFNGDPLLLLSILFVFFSIRWWATGYLPYVLIYKMGFFKSKRISNEKPKYKNLKKDFYWSLTSIFVFTICAFAIYPFYHLGWTQLYFDVSSQPWWMYVVVPIGMYVLYDINFYSWHKYMHVNKWMYKKFHYVHHYSHPITPLSGWSFHPVEAFLTRFPFYVLMTIIFPMHPLTFFIFICILSFFNLMGHSGLEFRPNSYKNKFLVSSTYHFDHHKKTNVNIKSFFNFWWF